MAIKPNGMIYVRVRSKNVVKVLAGVKHVRMPVLPFRVENCNGMLQFTESEIQVKLGMYIPVIILNNVFIMLPLAELQAFMSAVLSRDFSW